VRGANEERIVERLAQSGQRRAHCRLAHAEPCRGLAHAAFLVKRHGDRQQVEIEPMVHVPYLLLDPKNE